MSKNYVYALPAFVLLLSVVFPAASQTAGANTQHPRTAQAKQEPCWQQVGVSKDVIDQRDAIQQDTHSQVAAVCADTSLNMQQKKQKIHEIRQEAKQKMSGLISDEQQQQLEACHKERAGNSPMAAGSKHPGVGPCGEMESPNRAHAGQTTGSVGQSH